MNTFQGKVVMITGAAGNLGSAVARAFQQNEAHLVLVDHKEGRLAEMYPEWAESTEHHLAPGVDLTDQASVRDAVQKALDRLGQIDVLVNTVGGFTMGSAVHETELATWEQMMNLNARSVLTSAKAVVPHMLEAGSGKIINIGARTSLEGKPRMGAYSAAKAAVLSLTESMSAELKSENINVNCVLPGTIDTPPNRAAMPKANVEKWVTPESLAEVIMFLASDAARDIHGVAVPVFGK